MCQDVGTQQRGFINTLALSPEVVCVCVSRASMNVTRNYLNKLKTEVIAGSVAAT